MPKCWPRMRATGSTFADVDPLKSSMPMLTLMLQEYNALCTQRANLADAFAEYDQTPYFPIDSNQPKSKYHPTGLPLPPAPCRPSPKSLTTRASHTYPPSGSSQVSSTSEPGPPPRRPPMTSMYSTHTRPPATAMPSAHRELAVGRRLMAQHHARRQSPHQV